MTDSSLPEATMVETTVSATARSTTAVPSGTVVVIDPGHNGGNASHPEIINKQVPAGFGQYKACNTTGTATDAGYPEHMFNWQVALKLRDILQDNGITVLMTRDSDDGIGPCVNERAAVGNDADAAAVISIHGDGEAASVTGFFVMTASRPPAGADVAAATDALAADIRDGMVAGGLAVSNALGKNGLWARGDLGGLNLSLRPTVMIECGNMRNAGEAATMSSAAGQQQYAAAIATGVLAFLSP
jgi:N-acetylmuramoyl-L-alanine amidase